MKKHQFLLTVCVLISTFFSFKAWACGEQAENVNIIIEGLSSQADGVPNFEIEIYDNNQARYEITGIKRSSKGYSIDAKFFCFQDIFSLTGMWKSNKNEEVFFLPVDIYDPNNIGRGKNINIRLTAARNAFHKSLHKNAKKYFENGKTNNSLKIIENISNSKLAYNDDAWREIYTMLSRKKYYTESRSERENAIVLAKRIYRENIKIESVRHAYFDYMRKILSYGILGSPVSGTELGNYILAETMLAIFEDLSLTWPFIPIGVHSFEKIREYRSCITISRTVMKKILEEKNIKNIDKKSKQPLTKLLTISARCAILEYQNIAPSISNTINFQQFIAINPDILAFTQAYVQIVDAFESTYPESNGNRDTNTIRNYYEIFNLLT